MSYPTGLRTGYPNRTCRSHRRWSAPTSPTPTCEHSQRLIEFSSGSDPTRDPATGHYLPPDLRKIRPDSESDSRVGLLRDVRTRLTENYSPSETMGTTAYRARAYRPDSLRERFPRLSTADPSVIHNRRPARERTTMTNHLAAELHGIIQDAVDTDAHPGIRERLERLIERFAAEPVEVDASTELTASFGLEPEQECRARGGELAIATSRGDARQMLIKAGYPADGAGVIDAGALELAEVWAAYIRTGERPQ